jgi:hypothetical protein
MLQVTIANIDTTYRGVYDTDAPWDAAQLALKDLIENHGFFADNVLWNHWPSAFTPANNVVGIVLMPDQRVSVEDVEYAVDDENVYWVTVEPFVINKMFGE